MELIVWLVSLPICKEKVGSHPLSEESCCCRKNKRIRGRLGPNQAVGGNEFCLGTTRVLFSLIEDQKHLDLLFDNRDTRKMSGT
jgi:hypothetical protein